MLPVVVTRNIYNLVLYSQFSGSTLHRQQFICNRTITVGHCLATHMLFTHDESFLAPNVALDNTDEIWYRTGANDNSITTVKVEVIAPEVFRTPSRIGGPLRNICVANAYRLVSINNFVLPSAPDLTMAIMAGVSREAVDAHSAGTPGLTLFFMGP